MRFDVMTLFPDVVDTVLGSSIIGRAQGNGLVEIHTHNIRDWSQNKHRRVDDTPYGGGMGMLMSAVPIYGCYQAILEMQKDADAAREVPAKRRVIYLSPRGKVLTQKHAYELTQYDNLILLCGHYEGVDERIIEEIVDEELSIGDYVLTGGELPACVLVDCISRMLEGVLTNEDCWRGESIASGLLEYPQYTRPYDFRGRLVPEVLLSGHHANIEKWRREQAVKKTLECRPDLLGGQGVGIDNGEKNGG
ncbi:MAG: tRNA (guanosine(37)-N1)-methyltransferase TrmD [Ruminococcaceae bacterium]|nr:tRNA (guanosine(37)-N1)-methyltransferase TrmD [Oscillospiraceae bacterium]